MDCREEYGSQEFAQSDVYFDNHMVRMLCDADPYEVKHGQCTKAMLEEAKVNIVKEFFLVGSTEQIYDYLQLLAHFFCWSLDDVPQVNVNKQRSPVSKVSKEAIEVLSERNKYDLELYEFVQKLWSVTSAPYLEKLEALKASR